MRSWQRESQKRYYYANREAILARLRARYQEDKKRELSDVLLDLNKKYGDAE